MRNLLLTIAIGTILVGCAGVTEKSMKASGKTQASAAQITQAVAGNTLTGTGSNSGREIAAYYTEDGKIRIRSGRRTDTGSWRVTNDNLFCTKFRKFRKGVESCQRWYKDGNAYQAFRSDGAASVRWTVTKGNSQKL